MSKKGRHFENTREHCVHITKVLVYIEESVRFSHVSIFAETVETNLVEGNVWKLDKLV